MGSSTGPQLATSRRENSHQLSKSRYHIRLNQEIKYSSRKGVPLRWLLRTLYQTTLSIDALPLPTSFVMAEKWERCG